MGRSPIPAAEKEARIRRIATFVATGWSDAEIAIECGIAATTVALHRRSPLCQAEIRRISTAISAQSIENVAEALTRDAGDNFRFLQDTRNGEQKKVGYLKEEDQFFNHRLRAATILFDRQVPRKSDVSIDHRLSILLERPDVERMERRAAELGHQPIVVEAEVVEDAMDRVLTLGELLAKKQAEEAHPE